MKRLREVALDIDEGADIRDGKTCIALSRYPMARS